MSYGSKRNLQLDILRGIAILLVFGRHLEIPRPEGLLGIFADAWFRIGWLGVDLFFVLSGFLIGGLLVTELHNHGRIDVQRFLVRLRAQDLPALLCLHRIPDADAVAQRGAPRRRSVGGVLC
jgi:peptidoglycan/LPS O-acetylase OafA/YrhL